MTAQDHENNGKQPDIEQTGTEQKDTGQEETVTQQSDGDNPVEQRAGDTTDLATENADLKDRLLRALAETENIRRRAERDRRDASQYAVTGFARDLLAVSDNLRRALEHAPGAEEASGELKTLVEGVDMTEKELLQVFAKHGITKINPEIGEKFDHNLHQAMFEAPSDEHPKGAIIQIMQSGYLLNDRLLRPAMVGVAKATADEKGEQIDRTV